MKRVTAWLDSWSLRDRILVALGINFATFWIFATFLDGGAFPDGVISSNHYYIDNIYGFRKVSARWFWISFWHGLVACLSIGVYFAISGACQIREKLRDSDGRIEIGGLGIAVLGLVGVALVVREALSIAA